MLDVVWAKYDPKISHTYGTESFCNRWTLKYASIIGVILLCRRKIFGWNLRQPSTYWKAYSKIPMSTSLCVSNWEGHGPLLWWVERYAKILKQNYTARMRWPSHKGMGLNLGSPFGFSASIWVMGNWHVSLHSYSTVLEKLQIYFGPWSQGFRHPSRNKCMGWFAQIY